MFCITKVERFTVRYAMSPYIKKDVPFYVIHTVHFLTLHIFNQQNALIKIQ
jgi:hypothetical protein